VDMAVYIVVAVVVQFGVVGSGGQGS
jgi:hypothetical protein